MVLRLGEGERMVDLPPRKGEPEVDAPPQGSTKKCGLAGGEVVVSKTACKANEKRAQVDAPLQGSTKKPEGRLAEDDVIASKRACKANEKRAQSRRTATREHEEA